MRITIPLLLALGLAACADEPTEEERAAAVAEVEAHQTQPKLHSWTKRAIKQGVILFRRESNQVVAKAQS